MTVAIAEFWKLAVQSRLLKPADCQRLEAAFAHVKGAADQGNAATLGEWLVASGALSRYQVQTLLARRPGPFIFGHYCVHDRIRSKEGRLAGLYRAMHIATRHPVLLYFLSPEIAGNAEAWQAAAAQIAWACWVGHPYVSECHQLLELGKFKVVAIENLAGETAAARLARGARFTPHDACRLAFHAALGLARLHQLGLVHGDIRPDNFWLTPDGNLKLLQVPLAPEPLRGPRPLDWNTPTAALLTASDYAAPELAYEGRPPDALSDIYALGATLFHLISGAAPFPDGDLRSKVDRHTGDPIPSLAALGVPPQLDQVIAYMMAKDSGQRYQQAAQLAESLAYFVDPAALSVAPAVAPTLPAFDQWLQQQSRVPGMAAGAIPTGLQMAAYSAAQYAAQQAAAAGRESQSPTVAEQSPSDFDPSSNQAAPFESFDAPAEDPLAFVTAESNRPQLDLSALDLASGGRRAATEEMLEGLAAQADVGAVTRGRAAPAFDNLDAIINSPSTKPIRHKPVAMRRPASWKSNLMAVAVIGGALGVAIVVGAIIAKNVKGPRDVDPTFAQRQNGEQPPNAAQTTTTGQTSSSTTGTLKPLVNPGTSLTGTSNKGGPPETNPDSTKPPIDGNSKPPSTNGSDAVADDGKSLWASPTSGPPLNLNYVASGAQAVLAVRPANIVRRSDGDQILPALGPWGPAAEQVLKSLTGMPLKQIDQAIVVWHDTGNGQLTPLLIVRTQQKLAPDALLPSWGNPSPSKEGNESFYEGQPWSYYLPSKEEGKLLVVGQASLIKDAIHLRSAGDTPAMPAHLERMLKDTDAERDLTLAFIPGPLFSDSQAFFLGELAVLRKPAESFFGDDAKAGLVSLHFAGNFFIELRVLGAADKTPDTLASEFANRARSLPDIVENSLLDLNLHRYAKKLLLRFPEQLRVLAENTRSDVDDDMVVLRCYLPGVATNNLLLATELALAEQPLKGAPTGGAPAEKPQSIAVLLKKKTTLTFPRDTLEKSLQMLMDDVGIKYEIRGGDLQLEGITKNQSFGLDEKDKTAGEILRKIMTLANPDGKLVYVIKSAQPGGPETLYITTRSSAAKRGDKLPPELATTGKPPRKKKP